MLDILVALIPAITWGSLVFLSEKLGGGPYSQVLGTTIGALLFSIVVYFFTTPEFTTLIFTIGFISGVFWSIGQMNQFRSIEYLGVSKTVPLSTGMQLVGTSLFGVLVFGEWDTGKKLTIGIIALVAIIIGAICNSYDKSANGGEGNGKSNFTKGLLILLLSTVGYVAYVVIIRWFEIDGWTAILPQSIGMVVGAFIMSLKHKPYNKYTWRNIFTGVWWSTGNLALLLSIPLVGVATSFSLSQTGIIISTLGGIFFLGEKKTKTQMVFVIIGSILIIIGGVMLGFTK